MNPGRRPDQMLSAPESARSKGGGIRSRVVGLSLPLLLLSLLAGLLLPGPGPARAETAASELEQQIEQLRRGISEQESRIGTVSRREESLLTELARLDLEVAGQRQLLDAMQLHLEHKQQQLAVKQEELDRVLEIRNQARNHLRRRLAATHQMGSVGLLNILFTADSLPDLLELQDSLQAVLDHDRQTISRYREQIRQLEEARLTLESEEAELLAAQDAAQAQELRLAASREERAAFLNRVRTEKQMYQQALREIEAASQRVTAALAAQSTGQRQGPGGSGSFTAQRGRLALPAAGTIITGFGQAVTGRFGSSEQSRGITVKTEPGAEVQAFFAGSVVYAGVMEGYSGLIIIDHGERYFSLIARLAEIAVAVGDRVQSGEFIGLAGLDPEGTAGQLYLEIRRGVEAVDPLPWFDL
jgi:murein hydrolase activator